MGFLVYFFVLLVMASSVLFGLDWLKSPLHSPASQHRTHVDTTATRGKSEYVPPKASSAAAAVPIGRPQPPRSVAQREAEPAQPEHLARQLPPAQPERVAQQPSPPTETTGAAAPAETQKAEAKRDVQGANTGRPKAQIAASTASQIAAPAKKQKHARTAARRKPEHERIARVPSWAVRGAETARREAEERQAHVPPWALQGAETARREAEETQVRPFWISRDDGWRW